MSQLTRREKLALRECAGRAWDAELNRELDRLHELFQEWKRGDLSPQDLASAIHRFHHGPVRQLYRKYHRSNSEEAIAAAVSSGVLETADLPEEIRPRIRRISK